jgi:phenylacetate-coenzyme A ligase PaaK-like adenylate-forming protein
MLSEFRTMFRKMGEVRRNERMSRAEFESMKLEKFRRLVRHANQHSPYYSQIIRERGIHLDTCVPKDFPVLDKTILMANFDAIVTDRRITKQAVADFLTRSVAPNDLLFGDYHVLHTSGSSGEVGYFLYSELDWVRGMTGGMLRRPASPRPRLKKKGFRRWRMAYYAAVGGHFAGVSMMASAQRGWGKLFVKVGLFEVNDPLPRVIAQLNEFQPDFLGGYTTAIKILAAKQREGLLKISVLGIACAGEAMTPADKAYLEETFGCEANGGYGCTEHLMMGYSNPDGRTMTLRDDDLIYEFFDDHCLVTNLFNFTMPLIRYRMSDILRPIAQPNPTSPYIVVDSLVGRTEKMPMFLNRDGAEDFIHPISIVELIFAGVTRFQMQLVDRSSFRFLVCLDTALTAAQRNESIIGVQHRLREFLDQKLMNNVQFEVVTVDNIPLDQRTRKFKLIIDAPVDARGEQAL